MSGQAPPPASCPPMTSLPPTAEESLQLHTQAVVKRTLAAAYRQQAGWTDDSVAQREFYDLAKQVEALDGTEGCCPCCQEVTCDAGCPLEPVRRQ